MYYLIHGAGLDSTLMLASILMKEFKYNTREPITLVHIDYGQLAAPFECSAIEAQMKWVSHRGIDISVIPLTTNLIQPIGMLFTGNHQHSPEIPDRNGQLLDVFFDALPNVNQCWVGADPVPDGRTPMVDCTAEYFQIYEKVRRIRHGKYIKVFPMFLNLTWEMFDQEMRSYIAHPEYSKLMDLAMTCWTPIEGDTPRDQHCGKCSHCKKYMHYYDVQLPTERS